MAKSKKPAPAGDRDGLKISSTEVERDLYTPETDEAKAPPQPKKDYWGRPLVWRRRQKVVRR